MRYLVLCAVACGTSAESPPPPPPPVVADARVVTVDAEVLPEHQRFPTLARALEATIPADARVLGIGELHARVDRPAVRSSLAAMTEALPAIGANVSDLVVETWVVDPKCGKQAVKATKQLETEVRRPEATKSEIQLFAEAAKTAGIRPHAMTLSCADYKQIADPVAMLTVTTKELTRIASSAVAYRDKEKSPRRWIAVYGGALHNDRFPDAGVAEWSYAAAIDKATADHYVELDIIAPELAELDAASQRQPWFPLVASAREVRVWKRGERSFVIVLPRSK